MKSKIDLIKVGNKTLEAKLTTFQTITIDSFKQLEEKAEDHTNRQLRQTMVVKGLAEKLNEKWAVTKNLLAKHVTKNYQMFKTAFALFDRVHRGWGNATRTGGRERVTFTPCVQNGRIASFWFGTRMVQTKPNQRRIESS